MVVVLEDSPETAFVTGEALVLARGYGGVPHGLIPGTGEAQRERALAAAFSEAVSAADLRAPPPRLVIDPARSLSVGHPVADLVFLARGEYRDAPIASGVEPLLRQVPCPFVVTSSVAPELRTVAIAYDGSPASIRALAAAADLASSWKPGTPSLVLIAVVPRGVPRGRPLAAARIYLERYELEYRAIVREGSPATEIPELAERLGADLVCMGAFGHTAWRERLFGSTTRQLLALRRGPTLLCH